MYRLKYFHLACGVIALIAFVLSGQYMAIFLKGLQAMPDGPRLLYRSAHLYLMWAALLNIIVGVRFPVLKVGITGYVQIAASLMLLIVPALMLVGFAVEPQSASLQRPFTSNANYLALLGVLLHVTTSRDSAPQRNSNQSVS